MANKGTITLLFRSLVQGNVYVLIDFEVLYGESKIELTNPRINIPKLEVKEADARLHPEWRTKLSQETVQEEIKRELLKFIDPVTAVTLPIDMKEIWS